MKNTSNVKNLPSSSNVRKSTKGKPRLKYGPGYKGLLLAVCNGDRELVKKVLSGIV